MLKIVHLPKTVRVHTFNTFQKKFLTYNTVFRYTAILQPSLNPKRFSRKLSDPNLVSESKFFTGQSYLAYLVCAAFYT